MLEDYYYVFIKKERFNFNEVTKYKVYKKSSILGYKDDNIKLDNNLRRARRNIHEIIELNTEVGHFMVTLTYKENMQDYQKAERDFDYYIRKLGRPKYLKVMELQKRGAIHFHILIFNKNYTLQELHENWTHGVITDIQDIDDITNLEALKNYFSKYVSDKDKGQLIDKHKRLYSTSRGLKRLKKSHITKNEYYNYRDKGVKIKTENYEKVIINK